MPEPLLQEPAAIFLTILAVIFISPLLSKQVRLPGIVGVILGGIIIGQHGLNLLAVGPTIQLFGSVGLIYLMFNAGLEIDLDQFQVVRNRSIVFAALSYALPQASGFLVGRLFGLGWQASVLLGAIYASQTLVAYPVLSRLGIMRNEAVSITVGATVFTDITSLLVLSVIVGSKGSGLSLLFLGRLILLTVGYALLVLLGVPRLGKLFFQHFSGQTVEFQFVLVVLFIAAVLAQFIGIHTIVGAFLVGLAINATLSKQSRVTGQVLFLGESLFVPLFLMTVGMRLDPVAIFANVQTLLIGLSLTAAVYVTKFVAAWITAWLFNYSSDQMLIAWGLSQAQAAATLATILVATQNDLFPEYVFNGAILMILLTSITSPLVVEKFGAGLKPPKEEQEERPRYKRILLPIYGGKIPEHLIELAVQLHKLSEGKLLVLNLAENEDVLKAQRGSLESGILKDPEADTEQVDRIETSTAKAIIHAAIENQASLVVLDWPDEGQAGENIFGETLNEVIWNLKTPLFAAHISTPVNALERVVMVVSAHTVGVKFNLESLETAKDISEAMDVPLVVMTTRHYLEDLENNLDLNDENSPQLIRLGDEDSLQIIDEEATENDLVILPSMGSQARFEAQQTRVPFQLMQELESSLLVIHFP